AEDGIRDRNVTGVQTCALPISRVLLLDEPLSNLDAKVRQRLRVEIRRLQRRVGITTVYVTHDQEEALAIADRVVLMSAGRVVQRSEERRVGKECRTREGRMT